MPNPLAVIEDYRRRIDEISKRRIKLQTELEALQRDLDEKKAQCIALGIEPTEEALAKRIGEMEIELSTKLQKLESLVGGMDV
jgi:chromosome segregation ATPase